MAHPWKPTTLPHHHRDIVAAQRRILVSPSHPGLGTFREGEVIPPDIAREKEASTKAATAAAAERLSNAELYWVMPEMAQWALDASQDMPDDFVPAEHMPDLAGLIAFQSGLPPLPVTSNFSQDMAPMPVRVLSWHLLEVAGEMHLLVYAWTHIDELSSEQITALREDYRPVVGAWHMIFTTSLYLDDPVTEANLTSEEVAVVYLLGATWLLMQTPTMVQPRIITPPDRRKARGGRRDVTPRTVKVVELRRLAYKPTGPGETDEMGREYRHRWVVRGHWRQQAHGPKRSQRRTQWIPPYIKGPEGAPLLPTEHVNVWRR